MILFFKVLMSIQAQEKLESEEANLEDKSKYAEILKILNSEEVRIPWNMLQCISQCSDIKYGKLDQIQNLFKNLDDGVNAEDNGYCPLDTAFFFKQIPIAKWLLQQEEIIVDKKNKKGKTVLHTLIWNCPDNEEYLELLDIILKKGLSIESTDNYKDTLLHYAVKKHSLEITKYLLRNQANPNALNGKNEVPLQFCYKSYFYNSIEKIKEKSKLVNEDDARKKTQQKIEEMDKNVYSSILRFSITKYLEDNNKNLQKSETPKLIVKQKKRIEDVLCKLEIRHQAIKLCQTELQSLFDKYAMMIILFLDEVEKKLDNSTCQVISEFCFSAQKFGVKMDILRDKYVELKQEKEFNDILSECETADFSFDVLWTSIVPELKV